MSQQTNLPKKKNLRVWLESFKTTWKWKMFYAWKHTFFSCMHAWIYTCVRLFLISFSQRGKTTSFLIINWNNPLTYTKYLQKKTSAALFIKGILAQSIWRIFCTLPLDLSLILPPLWEQRVEKLQPWRCRLWPHAWSLRTYIQSSPAHEASDSHTQILDMPRVQLKKCFTCKFSTTPSKIYLR